MFANLQELLFLATRRNCFPKKCPSKIPSGTGNKNELKVCHNLQVIGDITCDVDGSVPSTIKSTTIKTPNFYLNKENMQESKFEKNSLAIMAVAFGLPSFLLQSAI